MTPLLLLQGCVLLIQAASHGGHAEVNRNEVTRGHREVGSDPLSSPRPRPPTHNRCVQGRWVRGACECDPCWAGVACDHYVDLYSPRFLIHAATALLPANATGVVYRAWTTDDDLGLTCPLGPGESARCPCATVTYQLFTAPGDRSFVLDADTGVLTRAPNATITPGTTLKYKIMVQGIREAPRPDDLPYDLLDLKIYVSHDHVRKIPWL